MEENNRFFEIVELLKKQNRLTDYVQLASILNTNKAGITDLKKLRKKLSIEILKGMKNSYPDINIDWILTGQGEMLRSDSNSSMPQQTLEPQSPQQSEVITLLKEQLKEKETELKELYQEIGQLKLKTKELEDKVRGLDLSGLSSSHTRAHSQDVTSVNVPSKK